MAGGGAELAGYNALEGAFFLFILGAYLLLKPWFEEGQLFGEVT